MNGKAGTEIHALKKLIGHTIFSLLPVIAAGIAVWFFSGSMAILALVLSQGLNLFVFFFSFLSIRIIEKSTVIRFPYGTGKLENFASFLIGAITIPACLYIIVASILKFFNPDFDISFGITQVLLVLIIARAIYLTWLSRHITHVTKSPLALAYYENFRSGLFFFAGAFIALLAAWILDGLGYRKPAAYIDPALALIAMTYMLMVSIRQVVRNYRVLIDLPLAEEEQMKILNALSREYESFHNIGNIYTRASGKHRFIDIELFFTPDTSLEFIDGVSSRIQSRLAEEFHDLTFHLIPVCKT